MRDLPEGAALLDLARSLLLEELLPLLPEERRLDARLVAAAMAVAEREMRASDAPVAAIEAELERFYEEYPHPNPPPPAGEGEEAAGPSLEFPLPRNPRVKPGEGRVGVGADAACEPDLLRRFAHDLRRGAFEGTSRERAARDLMWHITLYKLREGNPRFLAANGFA